MLICSVIVGGLNGTIVVGSCGLYVVDVVTLAKSPGVAGVVGGFDHSGYNSIW